MSIDPDPHQHDARRERAIEEALVRFLDLRDRGDQIEIDQFLAVEPEDLRSEIRTRITSSIETLAILGGVADEQDQIPAIPGFRIDHVIGSGALGTVYRAQDETLDRAVAIKVLRRGTAESRRARILAEGRRAAALGDRAIVTIHSLVEEGDLSAIVMELIEGHSIDRVAAALNGSQKAKLLAEVARALRVAHSQGIIHRDLKPQNVLVTPELEVCVLDFGLAVSSQEEEDRQKGLFEGTPLYASPEQVAGEALLPASDLFSFGSLMYRILTGEAPFHAETVSEIFDGIVSHEPTFPRRIDSTIDTDLQAICLACLAKNPDDRPSAKEVHEDLRRYLVGDSIRLRPALYSDILKRNISRHGENLEEWSHQGLISEDEKDRLDLVYRRIIEEEDHWIADARSLTLKQILLYAGAWLGVMATALFAFYPFKEDPGDLARWLAPTTICFLLIGAGEFARRHKDQMVSAVFLSSAVLALVPTMIALLRSFSWLAVVPPDVQQLLGGNDVTNQQLLAATLVSMALSLFALRQLRMTAFAWTTTVLIAASYLSLLLVFDYLGWNNDGWKSVAFLPLALLLPFGLQLERRGRVRWALPFHLLVLLVVVLSLDALAHVGGPLELIEPVTDRHLTFFAYAINGAVFIAVMWICEHSKSLDLRRGAKILEWIAPFHILGGLLFYATDVARIIETPEPGQWVYYGLDLVGWRAVGLYLAAVAATLALASWGWRSRFLFGGLAGIITGTMLLLEQTLLPQFWVVIVSAVLGLVVALWSYYRIRIREPETDGVVVPGR
ncbi:MAG: serine/threonine-protein kinase [Planctomycetota bacterium]|nr:serine/threonine-protein kinase [Planctomycetota bacterium]